ncbi:MAG TPA: transposase [Streptosporangiaceae bacterium]|nr:transposase [Streptosporangiaceae bacterium]
MLPDLNLPASLAGLLAQLRPVFTGPSFATFCGLVAGLAGQVRRRTVCGMLAGAGLGRCWPHDRAHYFFARAAWDLDQLGLAVARLAVLLLVPPDAAITVAVDDSVFRRCGRRVFGAAWQHDGSSPAKNKLSYGNCFVTCGILVTLPFCARPVCLPVLARLHVPGRGRQGRRARRRAAAASTVTTAAALVALLAGAFPGRAVHVVADAHYHGPALRDLPPGVTWTTRLPRNAVLFAPAPPRVRKPGRPPRKGPRLGTWAEIAASAAWTPAVVHVYGRDQGEDLAEIRCLWYGCLDVIPVRVILARDTAATLALVTTDLAAPAAALVQRYAGRWGIEQAFTDARNVLGAGEARTRARRAVQRTVPFALLVHTLVVLWYARHGYDPRDIDQRRAAEPWYPAKTGPAFEDMLTKLRRVLITARISGGSPAHPEPEQITAVLAAWHAAAA